MPKFDYDRAVQASGGDSTSVDAWLDQEKSAGRAYEIMRAGPAEEGLGQPISPIEVLATLGGAPAMLSKVAAKATAPIVEAGTATMTRLGGLIGKPALMRLIRRNAPVLKQFEEGRLNIEDIAELLGRKAPPIPKARPIPTPKPRFQPRTPVTRMEGQLQRSIAVKQRMDALGLDQEQRKALWKLVRQGNKKALEALGVE